MGTKISALAAASALAGTEQIPGVQSGVDVKITPAQLFSYFLGQLEVVSTQSGTTYTAVLTDIFTYIRFTNAGPVTFTIPPNIFPVGAELSFEQSGAGKASVAAGGGVTINSRGALLGTAGQYAVCGLKQTASNVWTLTGDLG